MRYGGIIFGRGRGYYGILRYSLVSYVMSGRFFLKPALSNKCINTTLLVKRDKKFRYKRKWTGTIQYITKTCFNMRFGNSAVRLAYLYILPFCSCSINIFSSGHYPREFCVSKWVWLDTKKAKNTRETA